MRRLLVLLVPLAIACGSDAATGPTQLSMTGTWELQSVNGVALPFVISQTGSNKIELVSEVATAVAGGNYTTIKQYRTTINGQVSSQSDASAGVFVVTGTAVTIQRGDGSVSTGSLSGNNFTLAEAGMSLVYRKR